MCSDGASWGNYQSLIQLGVGLNLGYAVLEAVLKPQFNAFTTTLTGFIDRLQRGETADLSLREQWTIRLVSRVAAWVVPKMFSIGVYFGIGLTVACIALLTYSSEHAEDCVSIVERIGVVLVSVGWAVIYLIMLVAFRVLLGRLADKLGQ